MKRPLPATKVVKVASDKEKAIRGNFRNRVDEALFLLLFELMVIPAAHLTLGVLGVHFA